MKPPPTSDGETHWPNYGRKFEAPAEYNHQNNDEKATAFSLDLRAKALAILPYNITERQKDYEAIVAADQIRESLITTGMELTQRLLRLDYPDAAEQFALHWE